VCVCVCGFQRALLEQKQRRKRQEPLMVQPNTEARPRRCRARRGEEQAPLVEPHVGVANDVAVDGEEMYIASHHSLLGTRGIAVLSALKKVFFETAA